MQNFSRNTSSEDGPGVLSFPAVVLKESVNELVLKYKGRSLSIPTEFFSQEQINNTLLKAGTTLEHLQAKIEKPTPISGFIDLKKLAAADSPEAVKAIIAENPTESATLFPLAYNLVNKHFTIPEFIDAVLEKPGDLERAGGLLRWLPLYCDHIGSDGTGQLLKKLIEKEIVEEEKSSEWILYESLARYADYWSPEVSCILRLEIFTDILNAARDTALSHFLTPELIPPDIMKKCENHYMEISPDKVSLTEGVIPVKSQTVYAGTCQWGQALHYEMLADKESEYYGKVGIIRVEGKAIFSLKLFGEPSMVALRTLKGADGRFVTIRGALYAPPAVFRDIFRTPASGSEEFRVLDLEGPIKVLPLGWVDNTEKRWSRNKSRHYLKRLSEVAEEFSIRN